MPDLAEILEEELEEAVGVKDKKALKRYIALLLANIVDKHALSSLDNKLEELKSDVKVLAEVMREGFRQIDKRFEELTYQMDKRFEAVDKRFEDLIHCMDKRFEAVDKRFEMVDKRFKDMNKRIGFISWFVPTIITLVVVVLKFV